MGERLTSCFGVLIAHSPTTNPDLVLAKSSTENFPVALKVLPKKYRQKLTAFYGFARLIDDLGDEYEGNRLEALDWAEAQLKAALSESSGALQLHPIFAEVQTQLQGLNPEPFLEIIEANRLDQRKNEYATYEELDEYCRLSANPVGHIVLLIFGADSKDRRAYSNSVCTGLQILEHIQDISEDYSRGRIYIPAAELSSFGLSRESLKDMAVNGQAALPELRRLVLAQLPKVKGLLGEGKPLAASLNGWAKLAVSGYIAGGLAYTRALKKAGGDITSPKAHKAKRLHLFGHLLKLLLTRPPKKDKNSS